MRLKKIKLAGFKSFVDPTTIPFPSEMTAVVGPNGCGKSNVIDAVRWVLGESSAKNLRGDAMTDVIFNGSTARKPVGQCSVELVFDNHAGRIGGEYAAYTELSVRRLVTRDAQSNYFLNGAKCRRRDITDLFLGTGLGPRSYAIIEQGMISRLIESKPQDLRTFIEEAAGISKYKERRRETENRIRHTQDNLDRLNDVREELGRQLEKLQRQAAAATRYKALRAKVRTLKGELAALRYLKNSEHIDALQGEQAVQQQELDALISRQQGDEAGMLSFRERQADVKGVIDDIQQQIFSTSTAITRIEQNTLHSQQRKQQIEAELAQLSEQIALLLNGLQEANSALQISHEGLLELLPHSELNTAELEQARERVESGEQQLRDFNAQSREYEQTYNRLKQDVQSYHSQIQSTTSMQLRTSQRIRELNEELLQLDNDNSNAEIRALNTQIEIAEAQVSDALTAYVDAQDVHRECSEALQQNEQAYRGIEARRQTIDATIKALTALQEDAATTHANHHEDLRLMWQQLKVPHALNDAVETVLRYWHQPYIAASLTLDELSQPDSLLPPATRVFTAASLVSEKQPGSLAEALPDSKVPSRFNRIMLCKTEQEALALAKQIEEGQSVLSYSGLWCSRDWILRHGDSENSVLHRASKLEALNLERDDLDDALAQAKLSLDNATTALFTAERHKDDTNSAHEKVKNELLQHTHALKLLTMQQAQYVKRGVKLQEEIEKQQQLLQTEDTQLAHLSEKLELQEAQILEYEVQVEAVNEKREQHENNVLSLRAKVEQLTQQNHETALKVQQLESQQNLYQLQVTRNEQQLADYRKRHASLTSELKALDAPQATQRAELQELLSVKNALEQERAEHVAKQEDIEQLLREAEKGQQSLLKDIQTRTSGIEKLNVEIEGYRVRGTAILEQLDETKQSLKSLLETLPEGANEAQWQKELDSTQTNLSRLGAVNLAAVEEFDVQSERKQHLDTQHNDLTEALETLQSAIRKIDKETRTRFSSTFEKVNEDLKQLFPKVFGGGSAYLALTDDDLLETGVTIMARPPGKKNSTIHLLSGGEKALTALSLVFAIFRLNPAPFCLLDEVDAPLDDANVGRFCNLVSEMSQTVQFIYITHNKIAMEMASHLTGVTMAEPGVSRMVAVDVDEAMAFAEA